MRRLLCWAVPLLLWQSPQPPAAQPPSPVPATQLQTRWAAQVTPDRVLPEYPRPQMARRDWINLLKVRHQQDILSGRRVTGPWMDQPVPHFNGSLMMHLSTWIDLPSLHSTPPAQAWDMFHAAALMSQGAPTHLVKNIYGSTQWTPGALAAVAHETAWLANTKDGSAIAWAEQTLLRQEGVA